MKTTTITKGHRTVTVHYFDTPYFTVEGRRFKVWGVDLVNNTYDIKGESESKTMKEETLIKLFKSGKLKAGCRDR